MKESALVLFVLVQIVLLQNVGGLLLDLFGEKDRHGISIRLEVSDTECSTFPVSWSSKAASVNTLGSCVQLYDEPLCKGTVTIIQPFHTIHQMDLSLINFASRIQSGSSCGPKIKTGRFVIQNAADASVLTVSSKYGGFARAFTVNASKLITKAQQWDIVGLSNSEYSLKPREFGDNYPVSYDENSLKDGKIVKKLWKLMSVGRGRYLIKSEKEQRCLYKTEENKVEEHDCRVWSPNQEWVLKEIFGNPKSSKKPGSTASHGPGFNYNVLSKVASYIPPSKPIPEFAPIFVNASILAGMKRKPSPVPYTVQKKIRRGPRPVSRPSPQLLSYIRPPGLRDRPALANKVANNNKFLLLKTPPKTKLKEFVPTDDRIETYAYYQQVLLSQKEKDEELKKNKKTAQIPQLPRPPPFPPSNKKKKGDEENDDDDDEDEEDDQDDESTEKKTITITIRRKKKKDDEHDKSDEEHKDQDSDEDSEEDDKPKKKQSRPKRPPPTQAPFNPYDINFVNFDHNNQSHTGVLQDDLSSGFLQSVFYKVKSLVPSVPFLSSKDENKEVATGQSGTSGSNNSNKPPEGVQQYETHPPHSSGHENRPPRRPQRRPHGHKDGPQQPPGHEHGPPQQAPHGHRNPYGGHHGLRLPKRKSSTTTTTEKSGLLGFLG